MQKTFTAAFSTGVLAFNDNGHVPIKQLNSQPDKDSDCKEQVSQSSTSLGINLSLTSISNYTKVKLLLHIKLAYKTS